MPGISEPIWTVLVVDDEAAVRDALTDVLTDAGYTALGAPNGARALDMLKAVPGRCLVLLDLDMPLLNGVEFLRELQRIDGSGSRYPVIIVSGVPAADDAGRLPFVMEVVRKPVDREALLTLVREQSSALGS